jgi:hypothetical protein
LLKNLLSEDRQESYGLKNVCVSTASPPGFASMAARGVISFLTCHWQAGGSAGKQIQEQASAQRSLRPGREAVPFVEIHEPPADTLNDRTIHDC